MVEIFVDCQCGKPNVISGADPSLLDMYRASPGVERCSNCKEPLAKETAYRGKWSEDGTEVLRLPD